MVIKFIATAWPLLFVLFCIVPAVAESQDRVYKVGILSSAFTLRSFSNSSGSGPASLAQRGYDWGENLAVEEEIAIGSDDQLAELAAELVANHVDVIVAEGLPAARSAQQATQDIPIIAFLLNDPVASGLVKSLDRPDGNVTGVFVSIQALHHGQLELLTQLVPHLKRVGFIWNPDNVQMAEEWPKTQATAHSLGLELVSLEAGLFAEMDEVFNTALGEHCDALLISHAPTMRQHYTSLGELAIAHRLPVVYSQRISVQLYRGLMSYVPDDVDVIMLIVDYIDKLLQGANPANLPIKQVHQFDLFFNSKTVEEMAIDIPPTVLNRVTYLIEGR